MHITVFSTQPYDKQFLTEANRDYGHDLRFLETRLDARTVALAEGAEAVSAFVNDHLDRPVLEALSRASVRLVCLRCAGFNNVDLKAAVDLGITIARVPAYSPHAVAEHAVALVLSLNRRIHKAYARVREANFALSGLLGFDLHGRSVGVVGTGKIGQTFAQIMHGFGCKLYGFDPQTNPTCEALGLQYTDLDTLLSVCDVISLHCPLNDKTHHLIDDAAFERMRPGVMLINTGRGALIDTRSAIRALKSGKLGFLGIDVYEEEESLFFQDLSQEVVQDDVFMRLLTFPNVIVTAHQGFFTREALLSIAHTTLGNATAFASGQGELHTVASN